MFDFHSLNPHAGEQEFVVEREFTVPRALLFEVFTHPEHLKHWWAPQPYTIPTCTVDLRPGGIWHYSMRSPEGQEHVLLSFLECLCIILLLSSDDLLDVCVGPLPEDHNRFTERSP